MNENEQRNYPNSKVYNDGSHYIAIPQGSYPSGKGCKKRHTTTPTPEQIERKQAFENAYAESKEVSSIEEGAFLYCSSLTEFNIPNGVTQIGNKAFQGAKLKNIHLPQNINSIGYWAFAGCRANTITVDVGNAHFRGENNCLIRLSDNSLIAGCDSSIIPSYVEKIDAYAFYDCENLASITIPKNVKRISDYAFSYCEKLATVNFESHSSLKEIGSRAFGSTALSSITIPASVNLIEPGALNVGSALTDVYFENTYGWQYYKNTSEPKMNLSPQDLADSKKAATYLKSTYNYYYWSRS